MKHFPASRAARGCTAVLALFLLTHQSCYHYRIQAPQFDPSTEYQRKTAHNLFWGLVKPKDLQPANCNQKALDEVYVTTNLGYALITVATLGIWCPLRVEWKCAKPCPKSTDF